MLRFLLKYLPALLTFSIQPAIAASPPATQPSPYHIVYDNGASVDVLAVSVSPSRHKPFWSPDGQHIIEPPYTALDQVDPFGSYEIVIRINGAGECAFVSPRAIAPISIGSGPSPYPPQQDVQTLRCSVPESSDEVSFELGIAANRWQLVQSFTQPGVYGDGPAQISVAVAETRDKWTDPNAQLVIRLAPVRDDQLRLVAVDRSGSVHVSTGSQTVGNDHERITAEFPDLAPDRIKEYRLEKCAYEWKPITGIHLKPAGNWELIQTQNRVMRLTSQEQRFNPKTDIPRIEDAIEKVEHLNPFDDSVDAWVTAIKELSDIGAPAVPAVAAEIRRTGRPYERSGLAIALRAIDDPRAVPGLIDALADCPFAANDYGGQHAKDPGLNYFMIGISGREYDERPGYTAFGFGRPVNEIRRTLVALTAHDASPDAIMEDRRSLYQNAASRWLTWWNNSSASLTSGFSRLRQSGGLVNEPLQLAIAQNQFAEVKKLIDAGADVNLPGTDGWTPLHLAAAMGQEETVQLLLDHNANVEARTVDGCSPLQTALGLGVAPVYAALPEPSQGIVELLLDNNANTRAANSRGQTALHGAAAFDDPEIVRILVDHGALVNAKDHLGRTPLHRAAQCEQPLVVDQLITAGADVNAKDQSGRTPLRMTSPSLFYPKYNSPIVKQLLGHGAEAPIKMTIVLGTTEQLAEALKTNPPLNEKPAQSDRSLLDSAIFQGTPEKVQMLLDAGADPNGREVDGNTPLHAAVFAGNTQIVSMLIAAKADVNARGQGDEPPLFWACIDLKPDIVDLLLEAGAKATKQASPPIGLAVQGVSDSILPGSADAKTLRAKRIILALLAHGADINDRADSSGYTPIFGTDGEMAEFLLQHGARLDVTANDGDTQLHHAAVLSLTDAVTFLLDHHVPLEAKNKKGETPLARCVAFSPRNGVVKLLLDAGADVKARDNLGDTPLHAAVVQGGIDSVQELLDKGADINAKDNAGLTPLHLAAKTGNEAMIRCLLERGADPNAVDSGGRTPQQWATNQSAIDLLTPHNPATQPAR